MEIQGIWRAIILVFGLLLNSLFGVAQLLDKGLCKGVKYFEKRNYVEALNHFQTLDSTHINGKVANYMAMCYLRLYRPVKSLDLLRGLPALDSTTQMTLLETYLQLEDFETAEKLVRRMNWLKPDSIVSIQNRIQDIQKFYINKKGFIVQNFGPEVNTTEREYNSVSYNHYNNLLFTKRDENQSISDIDGMSYESLLQTTIDSLNNWENPITLNTNLERKRRHDATVQVYAGGQRMITYHDGNLYSASLKDSTWVLEDQLKLHKKGAIDTHCFIDDNEQFLFFSSDFLANGEDLDIFYCLKMPDGKWSEPQPVSEINTPYDEDSPFLAKDSTLFFSSRGHNSIGGYDIFKTTYNKELQRWNEPVNLGYPINTVAEDTYYSTHGTLGYLTSSRKDGFGSLDLYRLFLFNMVEIKGQVVDQADQSPLANVEIDLSYDSLLLKSYTDIEGRYKMYMPINKIMNVRFVQDTLNLHEGQYLVNVFFKDAMNNDFTFQIGSESQKPQAVGNLETDKHVKKINIDIKSDFNQNPIIASIPAKTERTWVDSLNHVYQQKRKNKPITNYDTVALYFKTDSYELSDYHKKKLDSLFARQKSVRGNMTIDIVGYTDPLGSDDYNMQLSWRRANAAREYLSSSLDTNHKMVVRGMGETMSLTSKSDTKTYARYRRVEIKLYQTNEETNL